MHKRNKERMSAIGLAAKYGHIAACQTLIELGAKKSLGVGVD